MGFQFIYGANQAECNYPLFGHLLDYVEVSSTAMARGPVAKLHSLLFAALKACHWYLRVPHIGKRECSSSKPHHNNRITS